LSSSWIFHFRWRSPGSGTMRVERPVFEATRTRMAESFGCRTNADVENQPAGIPTGESDCIAVGVDRMQRNLRSVRLCSLLLWGAVSAWSVDPSRYISQYGHTAWRIQDGFLGGAANAIAQIADGYLWIGTQAGGYGRVADHPGVFGLGARATSGP
jgi:hypothetical protein